MSGFDDIIGAEDILGYDIATGADIDSLLGADIFTGADAAPSNALTRAAGGLAARKRQMLQQLAMRHATALTPRAMTKSREYTLGFSGAPVAIAGGTSQVLKASPQVPFKARRLIIPSDVAGALVITNFVIGKNPVLVSADPVAARAYTELGVGVDLNCDTAQISQLISLSMQNTSGASVSVTPTLIGSAVE